MADPQGVHLTLLPHCPTLNVVHVSTLVGLFLLAILAAPLSAATKAHVISFGKWQAVSVETNDGVDHREVRVRPLSVDGRPKEYTMGQPHHVTERVFVVARVLRLNDALPDETQPRWIWQFAGWVQVDRNSGRITVLTLPNFDPPQSGASWYRDYVAYCGFSDDNARIYAVVMQLGKRKAVLRKQLQDTVPASSSGPPCAATWRRKPVRVEFAAGKTANLTFTMRTGTIEEGDPEEDAE